jgi:ATP-dependent Clp protease ATP-binding subunit ClpA
MTAPMPQVQIRTHTQPASQPLEEEQLSQLNLSEYLAKEVYAYLLDLGAKLNAQQRNVVTVYDLALELLKQAEFAARFQGQKNLLELEEKLITARNSYPSPVKTQQVIFFSPELKTVVLEAFDFATRAGRNQITIADIWESLLAFPAIANITGTKRTEAPVPAPEQRPVAVETLSPVLSNFLENLSDKYKQTDVRPLIDREKEILQILRVLTRSEKNHCVLLGENGVGRSSIINGIAFELIHNTNLPANLRSYNVYKLDFPSMLAGGEFPGSNINKIAEEMKKLGKVILYIVGLRYDPTSQDQYLLNTFVSLLFREQNALVVISSDPSFYMSTLEKEPVIKEYFEPVRIDEPDETILLQIIQHKATELSQSDQVSIDQAMLPDLVNLARRYLGSVPFPQKAVSLLEEGVAMVKLCGKNTLDLESIKQVVAEKTGIPLTSITISDREKLMSLEAELNSVVIGQPQAVREVVEAIKRSRAGLKDQKKPIGSFLFLGPTGVGKTELAKQLAIKYYDDEKAFVRLDMSEYSEQHTSQRLIGSPPGYTGYEEGGQFTNPIIQRPYTLILLDEIEKAHPKIFDIFLQVLDEGRLTDSRGRLADFRNAILIFTSNIGSDVIYRDLANTDSLMRKNPKQFYELKLLGELLKYFRPEFINRFDEIIPFNPLGIPELVAIAKLKLKRIQGNLAEKKITLQATDAELEKLVRSAYDPRFGARPIERIIKDKIEDPIAQQIIAGGIPEGQIINWQFIN